MRKIVLAMMTTLNGRLDNPDAWMTGLSDDHYDAIDRNYSTFDTILVGRTTYEEMAEYWPTAGDEDGATDAQRSMADRMGSYRKYVFSTTDVAPTEWANVELVTVRSDDDLRAFVQQLVAEPGGDIHLSGGAALAQTFVRLGLVDEYRFFVYPVVSKGQSWFDPIAKADALDLVSATGFADGATGLHYRTPRRPTAAD